MKKILLLLIILSAASASFAQIDLNKATAAAAPMGFDVNSLTKSIMGTLTGKLKLGEGQTTQVTNLLSKFLTNKSGFMGLMQSKPAEYKTKLEGEQKSLFSGLKGILKPEQFTQFMNLKPKTNDTTNNLSQLFY
ncbi:MAG: hypothetical protein JNL53_08430 [Cyclobacteriaceae bacterium]|nr:hypothetical protein [Cyclobacteriaceae bacterium]